MAIKSDTNYKLESPKSWKPFSQTLKGYVGVIVYFYSKKTVQIDIFQWGLQWWWWLYDDDSFKMLAHCVEDYYTALDVPNLQPEFCFEMNYCIFIICISARGSKTEFKVSSAMSIFHTSWSSRFTTTEIGIVNEMLYFLKLQ